MLINKVPPSAGGCTGCSGLGQTFVNGPADFITGAEEWMNYSTLPATASTVFSSGNYYAIAGFVAVPILAWMLVKSMGKG